MVLVPLPQGSPRTGVIAASDSVGEPLEGPEKGLGTREEAHTCLCRGRGDDTVSFGQGLFVVLSVGWRTWLCSTSLFLEAIEGWPNAVELRELCVLLGGCRGRTTDMESCV